MNTPKIYRIPSPAICVIDDEPEEYEPILKALMRIGLGAVHVRGDNWNDLPPEGHPLQGLRLVFTDLNINNSSGRSAIANTAGIFSRIVPDDAGPVVVVIWSKVADDQSSSATGETNAEAFRKQVLRNNSKYAEKLIFTKMIKPRGMSMKGIKPLDLVNQIHKDTRELASEVNQIRAASPDDDTFVADLAARVDCLAEVWKQQAEANLALGGDETWVKHFQEEVTRLLDACEAYDVLWRWESVCQRAAAKVGDDLLRLAARGVSEGDNRSQAVSKNLQQIFKALIQAQAGSEDSSLESAKHLVTGLSEIAADNLEHSDRLDVFDSHVEWLSELSDMQNLECAAAINTVLLTANHIAGHVFTPGTIYEVNSDEDFTTNFGIGPDALKCDCFEGSSSKLTEWKSNSRVIVVELSPACDVHNRKRKTASLIAGLIVPKTLRKFARNADAWTIVPRFEPREAPLSSGRPGGGSNTTDEPSPFELRETSREEVIMVFCSRYRTSAPVGGEEPSWLQPLFRLRDMPAAAIRNWAAGQSARVGYLSLR